MHLMHIHPYSADFCQWQRANGMVVQWQWRDPKEYVNTVPYLTMAHKKSAIGSIVLGMYCWVWSFAKFSDKPLNTSQYHTCMFRTSSNRHTKLNVCDSLSDMRRCHFYNHVFARCPWRKLTKSDILVELHRITAKRDLFLLCTVSKKAYLLAFIGYCTTDKAFWFIKTPFSRMNHQQIARGSTIHNLIHIWFKPWKVDIKHSYLNSLWVYDTGNKCCSKFSSEKSREWISTLIRLWTRIVCYIAKLSDKPLSLHQ